MDIDTFIAKQNQKDMDFWCGMSDLDDEILFSAFKAGCNTDKAYENLMQAEIEKSLIEL